MAGVVHIPWYATGFRGDDLERALAEVSAAALRYNARSQAVYRGRDDRYKFLQVAEFEHKLDFERYWNGPEMIDLRSLCSGWFQIPVLYSWNDLVTSGAIAGASATAVPAPEPAAPVHDGPAPTPDAGAEAGAVAVSDGDSLNA